MLFCVNLYDCNLVSKIFHADMSFEFRLQLGAGEWPSFNLSASGLVPLTKDGPAVVLGAGQNLFFNRSPSSIFDFIPYSGQYAFGGMAFPFGKKIELNLHGGYQFETDESFAGAQVLAGNIRADSDEAKPSIFIGCRTSLNAFDPSCEVGIAFTGFPSKG